MGIGQKEHGEQTASEGARAPDPLDATAAAGAPDPLGTKAAERFGVNYLFPYQRLVITNVLQAAAAGPGSVAGAAVGAPRGGAELGDIKDHRDRQLVILPTGSGKSLCFQLPAMLLPGITVVVYPLLA
ncbi:MAG: hypothetical protein R6W94_15245, partial [Spirochaetia bacterium]